MHRYNDLYYVCNRRSQGISPKLIELITEFTVAAEYKIYKIPTLLDTTSEYMQMKWRTIVIYNYYKENKTSPCKYNIIQDPKAGKYQILMK